MRIKLIDELRQSGWRSSIMTTYSVDPQFYDRVVASRFRAYGCENNILIADAAMLDQALAADPAGFQGAGRRYVVAPARVAGCFHPKVSLRLAPDKARLLIGSANVTAAGWGHNQEITTALTWSRRIAADAPATAVVRKAFDYLKVWLQQPGEALAYKLDLMVRQAPWLADAEPNVAPIELDDGTVVDLFLEPGGGGDSTLAQFARAIGGETVLRLVIVSPYWDANLAGFLALITALGEPQVCVALNPKLNTFPVSALRQPADVTFADISEQVEGRFIHAKLILAQTADHDHVLFGSANCSDDALGGLTIRARNAEASVYRRLPVGACLTALGLDLSKTLDPGQISPPERDPPSPVHSTAPRSGVVELDVDRLIWTPPVAATGDGAKILFPTNEELPLVQTTAGTWITSLPKPPAGVLVVQIIYADGRVSGPTIVNDLRQLRRSAPGDSDHRLNAAIDKVLAGESDLIDLALSAQALFADSAGPARLPGTGRPNEDRPAPPRGVDYASPEAFRAALSAIPANGSSGRFLSEDTGLHDVLAIVLRGIANVDSRVGDRLGSKTEVDDLDAGEDEDGDEDSPIDPIATVVVAPRITYTQAELDRRRTQLNKVLTTFEARIEAIAGAAETPAANLPIQVVFLLKLMVHACRHAYAVSDSEKVTLMQLSPVANEDNSATFAVRAAKLLRSLWRETPQGSPIGRLTPAGGYDRIPDDVFFLIAITRWAMIRARLATADLTGLETLDRIIAQTAAMVFHATQRFSNLDEAAEEEFVRKLDEALGFGAEETNALLGESRRLLHFAEK